MIVALACKLLVALWKFVTLGEVPVAKHATESHKEGKSAFKWTLPHLLQKLLFIVQLLFIKQRRYGQQG